MLTTLTEARASLLAASNRQAPKTLAQQWEAYAAQHVSTTASAAEVHRAERKWYSDKYDALVKAPQTPENLALMAECRGWARLNIGRRA